MGAKNENIKKTQPTDAVRIFATAVRELDGTEEIEATKINCKHPVPWQHGNRIANYMRIVRIRKQINRKDKPVTASL